MTSATKSNVSFIQLSDPEGLIAMQALTRANPMAANVFYLLMRYMDKENSLIVSMQTIASILNTSRQTVSKNITYLKKNKYIAVYKSGTTNVYSLNANIVWKDRGDKKLEAILNAKVLLSLDEQNPDEKRDTQLKLV